MASNWTDEQLKSAFIKADDAGDTESARIFAEEISRRKSANVPETVQATQIVQPQQHTEGFGARVQRELENIPRQLGLSARYAIEGPAEMAGIFTNPIALGINKLTGMNVPYAEETGRNISDMLGLPSPEGTMENVIGRASKMMTGVGGLAGGSGLLAEKGAQGIANNALGLMAKQPGAQISAAAGGGSAGEYTKQTGGGDSAQLVTSLLGSLAGASAVNIGSKVNSLIGSVAKTGKKTAEEILLKSIEGSGVKIGDIPISVKKQMLSEIDGAMKTGGSVDQAAVKRLADYSLVGAKPTKGTISLDPGLITKERNLSKIAAQSGDEGLLALPRQQRQNELVLMQNLNDMGAANAPSPYQAGDMIQKGLLGVDAPRKAAVDAAYKSVRDASGRYAKLNTQKFSEMANNSLDEGALGAVLPKEARSILNSVSKGEIPLNVNTAMQIDETLSGLQRDVGLRTKAALAIGKIRNAIHETPIESQVGEEARNLYEQARVIAKARFRAIDANPAMKAALEDADPDKFVQKYLVGGGKDSSVAAVKSLSEDLKKSPDAFNAARQQVVSYLKNKALSGRPDEVGSFSPSIYNKELKSLSDKLSAFFNQDEIALLNAVGRVGYYEKYLPTGSAVNTSNTASAFIGALDRIAGNDIISRIPFGNQMIKEPIKNYLNQRTMNSAMNPYGALKEKGLLNQSKSNVYPVIPGLLQLQQDR